MSNMIIYKKDSDADLWAAVRRLAAQQKKSMSEFVIEGVRDHVARFEEAAPSSEPFLSTYVAEPVRELPPDPFARVD